MTITPGNFNFIIYAGRTLDILLTWADQNNSPINLTGYTAQLEARYNLTDSSPFITLTTSNGGIILGDAAGTITIFMSPGATSSLIAGEGVYDLEMTSPAGQQDSLIQGIVTVQEMPTR